MDAEKAQGIWKAEQAIGEEIEKRLRGDVTGLEEEILMAKRILKDPNLSHHATRKFGVTIEK